MKKLFQKLDPAYLKVALYTGGTVLVTYFVGLALYSALPGVIFRDNIGVQGATGATGATA